MFLGLDLSCYTTSCAIADDHGKIIYDERRLLKVPQGKCGLRQSEMVFEHTKNLKEVFPAGFFGVKALAVSVSPRPFEGSYMPVFSVAQSYGKVIERSSGAKLFELTHQHGHIGAALIGNDALNCGKRQVIALHVSGGTTDVLKVSLDDGLITEIEQLGKSSDICAGMFIDRIGVELGCGFPAGKELEKLALNSHPLAIPSSAEGLCVSFSGSETAARRLIEKGEKPEEIAAGVLRCVANALEKLIRRANEQTGINEVLLMGGVMCNSIIRERLKERLRLPLFFADRKYSSDNSCGLAEQARLLYERGYRE